MKLISGGNWRNGTNAGVFNSNGNNSRGNSSTNIGFRSALPHTSDTASPRACSQYRGIKGSAPSICALRRKKKSRLRMLLMP